MLHAGHPIVFTNNIFGPTIIRTLEPSVPTITTHNHSDARAVRPYNNNTQSSGRSNRASLQYHTIHESKRAFTR